MTVKTWDLIPIKDAARFIVSIEESGGKVYYASVVRFWFRLRVWICYSIGNKE